MTDALMRMLQVVESARPTAKEMLAHPWLAGATEKYPVLLSAASLEGLLNFGGRNRFQQAVLLSVSNSLDAQQMPELSQIFRSWNCSNTGILDKEEIVKGLIKHGVEPDEAQRAADSLDMNSDGRVSFSDFVAGCLSIYDSRSDLFLRDIFARFDIDRNQKLDAAEMTSMMQTCGLRDVCFIGGHAYNAHEFIRLLGQEGSGCVTYEEFRNYFMPLRESDLSKYGIHDFQNH